MATSKKWVYGTGGFPKCLRQTTFTPPTPSTLKPTEIQIANKAFAINPVDVQAMNMYNTATSYLPWPLSALTGGGGQQEQEGGREVCCDFAGTVTHAGAQSGYQVGDEVFGFTMSVRNNVGTATEVLTLNTADASIALAKKPATWSHIHAAALPLVWLTAKVSVEAVRTHVEKLQEKWLVVLGGSSATGTYTIHLAKAAGWRVLSTCSSRNVDFVRDTLGADEVVDYTAEGTTVPAEIARKLSGSVVVVDCVGGTECLDHAELGGRITRYVTIVGDKTDRSSMGGPAVYASYPRMLLRWSLGRLGLGVSYDCVILDARKEWLEEAGKVLAEKDIIVDSTFQFEELPKALEKMVGGRVRGKLVGVTGA